MALTVNSRIMNGQAKEITFILERGGMIHAFADGRVLIHWLINFLVGLLKLSPLIILLLTLIEKVKKEKMLVLKCMSKWANHLLPSLMIRKSPTSIKHYI